CEAGKNMVRSCACTFKKTVVLNNKVKNKYFLMYILSSWLINFCGSKDAMTITKEYTFSYEINKCNPEFVQIHSSKKLTLLYSPVYSLHNIKSKKKSGSYT